MTDNDIREVVLQRIFSSQVYHTLFMEAAKDLEFNDMDDHDFNALLQKFLSDNNWNKKLQNVVYTEFNQYLCNKKVIRCWKKQRLNILQPADSAQFCHLTQAQLAWERRMLKSVNTMATELNLPLAKKRPEKESQEIRAKWTELSVFGKDCSAIRPVYAPKDFLEVVLNIQNTNAKSHSSSAPTHSWNQSWGILQVPFTVKSLEELRIKFHALAINQSQNGVDDLSSGAEMFELEREKLGQKVIESGRSAASQEFCKRGCPLTLRGKLWSLLLNIGLTDSDKQHYFYLKQQAVEYDLLVDALLFKDVKLSASNDDQYFVFEDYLYQILLPFSRDTRVLDIYEFSSATPPRTYTQGKQSNEEFAVVYPPCGVIPFHGFSLYVAPLCYFVDDPVELYVLFRELYCRYLHRLHIISPDPQGIVGLCVLFEQLLQCVEPQLFYHMKSLGVQPIRLVFKWIMRAFSGYLTPDQVLLLWDRILAFDSLEILSVLAVAIFRLRKSNLMSVKTFTASEAVLADLTTLKVVPLLQMTLFSQ